MSKCRKCEAKTEKGQKICPLCFARIESNDKSDTEYPGYAGMYKAIKYFTVKKLFAFLSIAAGLIFLFLNFYLMKYAHNLWSLVFIAAILFCWGLYKSIKSKKLILAGRVLACYFLISAFLFVIDLYLVFHKWSVVYVIPFLTIALIVFITIITIVQKRSYKDYLGYLLATLFISIYPLFLCFLSLSKVVWPSIATLGYGLLTGIAFYIFMDKDFKVEMKKIFHY
ncbi:MAG: DUF6320 domain-containing protein [Spirochaetales bacterium]|jgi:NADH:ubiquinone oxidoreductase subunit K|nr:DUF6320 domain-containing protein [Spirochaetales bacterium]